jgi:hypothetical protein
VLGATLGGPLRRNKTFFFAGFQQDNRHSWTSDWLCRRRKLSPGCGRYFRRTPDLTVMGFLAVSAEPRPAYLALGVDPITEGPRCSDFASAALVLPAQ